MVYVFSFLEHAAPIHAYFQATFCPPVDIIQRSQLPVVLNDLADRIMLTITSLPGADSKRVGIPKIWHFPLSHVGSGLAYRIERLMGLV